VREGGRAIFLVGPPAQLERGITGESVSGDVTRQRLEAIGRLVDAGKLRPQIEAAFPFERVREALGRVAGPTHARQDRAADRAVALPWPSGNLLASAVSTGLGKVFSLVGATGIEPVTSAV
jgi:Zinc-binding dehydrogenase